MDSHLLVLGSHNRGKAAELVALLAPYGWELRTLADYSQPLNVSEDGATFAENAARKACQQALHLRAWVLAEDSGLEVDALCGEPGIHSARYAGPQANDATNMQRLLAQLAHVGPESRTARYVCHATLADPAGQVRAEVEAYCRGRIAAAPRGQAGFGYDPVFEVPEYHRTFGELGDAVKSVLSHRGRALRQLIRQLVSVCPPCGAGTQLPAT
ncbi:MAG: non-canonical purine NTP pyrophosphatase [Pirellulaceae bacterium]|jgi:XTP/dITP diphosphohydrolase|nr:non-canonical purine NTP pyrophosphatase [Pirellulaceae bacterium]